MISMHNRPICLMIFILKFTYYSLYDEGVISKHHNMNLFIKRNNIMN